MIKISYSRLSVCMGDDQMASTYSIILPDDATFADFLHVVMYGGCGNDWPPPVMSHDTVWFFKSNIGLVAEVRKNVGDGRKHAERLIAPPFTPLAQMGITWVYGDREE
ncbi:MAG: hypothetical protein Q4B68_05630 [Bacteroidales bacterium]|nr:hypothetical protein [Bacteroidales bacterium]